jgi:flagellin-like hook-associated protein FlgL
MLDISGYLRLNLSRVQSNVNDSMYKLSTGQKINSSKDNPALYAISKSISRGISMDNVVINNLNTANQFLSNRESILGQIIDNLQYDNPDTKSVDDLLSSMNKDVSISMDNDGEFLIPKVSVDLTKPVSEIVSDLQSELIKVGSLRQATDDKISSVTERMNMNQTRYHQMVDVDVEEEMSKLTKNLVLQKVGYNMINLYNQSLSNVLMLLRG